MALGTTILLTCNDPSMSQSDREELTALWDLSGGKPAVASTVAQINEALGRDPKDTSTLGNLQSLGQEYLVVGLADGNWALTPDGVELLARERKPSDG